MPYSLIWLPSVLERAGLKVAVTPGWEDRGHGDVGRIFGVICHHTATQARGNYPSMNTIIHGRSDCLVLYHNWAWDVTVLST